MTLADDYTTSIQADDANRAIQNNLIKQMAPLVAKFVTYASGATCIAILLWKALLTSLVGIELLSSSARVTSVKSQNSLVESQDP